MKTDSPHDDSVPEKRLHPWSWLFALLQHLKQYLILLIVLLVSGSRDSDMARWNLIALSCVLGVLMIAAILRYFTFRYSIQSDRITLRSGLLSRNWREIPFTRIHNVSIHRTLLHRLFGVAEVRLESAGSQQPEAEMRVLSFPEALALEDVIRGHARASIPVETAPPSTAGDASTRLTLSPAELVRLGLVSQHGLIVVFALAGIMFQIVPEQMFSELLLRGLAQTEAYTIPLARGISVWVLSAMAMAFFAFVTISLLSIALAFNQFYGFRLIEHEQRLTIERGLFARTRTTVPQRRIQCWEMQETLLQRLFKRRALKVAIAVFQGDEMRAFNRLAPIATPERCDTLIRTLLTDVQWPPLHWRTLSRHAGIRFFLTGLQWFPLIAIIAFFLPGPWKWLVLGWPALVAFIAFLCSRRLAYALDERIVAIRGGWWNRYWRFAEIDKVQALCLYRSPIDRFLGTASLLLDTAGGKRAQPSLTIRFMPESEARTIHTRLGQFLARRRLRW